MKLLSRVRLFATPWTAAYQAPLYMGFSRQEYWSGVPLPSPILAWALPLFPSQTSFSLGLDILFFFFKGKLTHPFEVPLSPLDPGLLSSEGDFNYLSIF